MLIDNEAASGTALVIGNAIHQINDLTVKGLANLVQVIEAYPVNELVVPVADGRRSDASFSRQPCL